jgi:chitodextrinase
MLLRRKTALPRHSRAAGDQDKTLARLLLARAGSRRVRAAVAVTAMLAAVTALALTPQTAVAASVGSPTSDGRITGPASLVTGPGGSGSKAVQFGAGLPDGSSFVHPGILLDAAQLNFVKDQKTAGAQPWTDALAKAMSYKLAGKYLTSPDYVPTPFAALDRATGSTSAIGLDDIAAYADALLYSYTGEAAYADKSIEIMNAWSSTLKNPANASAQLDAAWAAQVFPRAAEIIRYTYTPADGHAAFDVPAFSAMLTDVLLPQLDPTSIGATQSNGNWALSMADGTMNIGVFTDNRDVFRAGVAMWQARVPAYIYENTDGPTPTLPPGNKYDDPAKLKCFWLGSGTPTTKCIVPTGFQYVQGMSQETCRDNSHALLGLEAMVSGAETARLQGVDLYGQQQKRIVDAYEFAAKYDLQAQSGLAANGLTGAVDLNICGGTLTVGGTGYKLGFEMAYNEFANRLGVPMPYTKQMISGIRPTAANLHTDFETLTSAGTDLPSGCTTPDSRLGTVALTVTVPADGTYRIWSRINPARVRDSSYVLQIDHGCPISVGGGDAPAGQWSWVDYRDGDPTVPVDVRLTAGAHTLLLSGRSPGLAVSRVLLTADLNCVPTGDGGHCDDLTPPTAPTSLTSTAVTPTSVTLAWGGATDNTTIDHYEIYRDGGRIGTSVGDSYRDQSVAPETDYQYTVRTVDTSANRSGDSPPLLITTPAEPIVTTITAPAGDRPVHGMTTISARTSNDARVSSVEFLVDDTVVGTALSTPFAFSWDTGSVADGTHTVQARALDDAGSVLSTSDAVPFRVSNEDSSPPGAPTGLSAQAQPPASVVLTWDPASETDGVTGYRVIRNGDYLSTTAINAFTDTTAHPTQPYSYTIEAVDAAGNVSDASDAQSVTVPDTVAPTAPSDVTVLATSPTSVTLSWSAATDDVGVTRYEVLRDGVPLPPSAGTAQTYTDSSVSPSSSYTYTVCAYDAAGNESDPSTDATALTPDPPDTTAPSAPTGVTAVAGERGTVTLAWAAATDNVGVTGYRVKRGEDTIADGLSSTEYTNSGLASAATYSYVVYAIDAAGNVSSGSEAAAITMADWAPPTAPGDVAMIARTGTSITFGWPAATDDVRVTSYSVSRDGDTVATGLTTRSYTDSGLGSATSHTYVVYAYDAAGNRSAGSTPTGISTLDVTVPSQPAAFTASAGSSTSVNLAWSAASDNVGVTGYRLSRNGTLIATLGATVRSYVDNSLTAGTSYSYALVAVDAAGNASTPATVNTSTLPTVAPTGAGFAGQYFPNTTLSGPGITRLDPTINFAWGTGAPLTGIPANNFSARWTGQLTPTVSATYTFYTTTDDGTRLWVNNKLVIDKITGPPATRSVTVALTAGKAYPIRMEYVELSQTATAKLLWSRPGVATAAIPAKVMSSASTGLTGTYYASNDLSGPPVFTRPDATVNFAWVAGTPDSRLGADNFSARWAGKVQATTTGNYTFSTDSDDGVRLWVNGVLVIDNWTPHALATNTSALISLTAGKQYSIRMEYRELTGSATAKLWWTPPGAAKAIVPATSLRDR